MQTLTERVFKLAPPGGLFDETVIHNLFPDSSDGARALLVHRACQTGEILRLKPGLFVLGPPYRKSEPHPFVVAGVLHSPSHISLESALAHHGLIPEAVYQVSSVTLGCSRGMNRTADWAITAKRPASGSHRRKARPPQTPWESAFDDRCNRLRLRGCAG